MATPSYTTDLTTLNIAEAIAGWSEVTGAKAGGSPTAEAGRYIQGTGCLVATFTTTGLGSIAYTNDSAVTVPTDGAFFAWIDYFAPKAIATYADGGQQLLIGNSTAAYKAWYVGGSDTNAYGGWKCQVVNPTITADSTVGTPTTELKTFGYIVNSIMGIPSGRPLGIDVIRYGRGQALFTAGDATTPATFDGFALVNDDVTNSWGLIQDQGGSFLVQGLIQFGDSTTATHFKDSNKLLTIADNRKVTANFNTFEIQNASSYIEWNDISVQALGTASKGRWVTTYNATVLLNTCTFVDMNTFSFGSNTTIDNSIFRRCGQITPNGASFIDTEIASSTAGSSILTSDLAVLDGCYFVSDGSNHAVELTSIGSGTMNWSNLLSNYVTGATGSPIAPTNTGNEAIYVNVASGSLTINVANGSSVPSIRSAGATVNVVAGLVTMTFNITNPPASYEYSIYSVPTLGSLAGSTELQGMETTSGGVHTLTYTYIANSHVAFQVLDKTDFYQESISFYTLGSGDQTVNITLEEDIND